MNPSRLSPLLALAVGLADPTWAMTALPFDVGRFDRARVLAAAARYLGEAPITVTASVSARSAGGPHDFCLLFGGLALRQPDYIALWKTLPADSSVEEVVRNFFIRQPVLWVP